MAKEPIDRNAELDEERTLAILKSLKVIKNAGQPYKGIQVSNVSYTDADGEEFEWASGDKYAVVNFKAINEHGIDLALDLLDEEDFQGALNNNLSMRMSHEEAANIGKRSFGTLTCTEVALKDEDGEPTGETALLPYSFIPVAATEADSFDVDALRAKRTTTDKSAIDEDGDAAVPMTAKQRREAALVK